MARTRRGTRAKRKTRQEPSSGHEAKPREPKREGPGRGVENAEVARLFREVADRLEIQGANPFRIRAYRNAARTVEELPEPVETLAGEDSRRLTRLPGIGADLAGKIEEIGCTGSLAVLRELERSAPKGAPELMRLPGIGPKHARLLAEKLRVGSLADLEKAARAGRIRKLAGFGARTEEKILRALVEHRAAERRILRPLAAQYGEALVEHLRALCGVRRAEIAGSYRWCKETVGDLDVLVTCAPGAAVVEHFVSYAKVAEVLSSGTTKASVRLRSGLQVDLRVLPQESYGAGLHYFTGSKAHNIAVRRLGQRRGLKINEYGIWRGRRRLAGGEENDVFKAVGLPLIPPELREDRGEIEAAAEGRLPRLVALGDIRGDLQSHTTDSDGRHSLAEMAEAAQELGYEYLAITDHTPTVRIAGGLDDAGFRAQMKRIDRLNARLRGITLLTGAECDIHADGSLDLKEDTLAALDIVLVSIHSKFDLPEPEQTRRLLKALRHPSVDVFAHPTGRLLGRRRGATFDTDQVFRAAVEHGVLLEVDAQPERLDMDDVACRAAVERGARIVISTDAHSVDELRFMRWGVEQARRGWVEKKHVANARPLAGLLKLLHRGRK